MKKLICYIFISTHKSDFFIILCNIFSTNTKTSENSLAKYYHDHEERLQKKACQKYQSFSKEEKEKRYKNPPKDKKKAGLV